MGSLGATVVDAKRYLVGASGAVYALIFAHLGTLILNWKEDGVIYEERLKENKSDDEKFLPTELNPWIRGIRLTFIILFTVYDVGTIIYKVTLCLFKVHNFFLISNFLLLGLLIQLVNKKKLPPTSFAGHAFGAIAGATIGVFILKNRKVEDWEVIFQWVVFGLYALLSCIFITWHIAGGSFEWFFSEDVLEKCV